MVTNKILTNNLCEFEILNNIDILENNPVNILTTVFFKRDQYYKNFDTYIKGLQRLTKFIDDPTVNPNNNKYFLLLFIDNNVYNDQQLMTIINESPNTIPVLFKCSNYMKDNYHIDLFGTLIRFFPMFDFDNNPFDICCCVDVDLHVDDYYRLKQLMINKPKGFIAGGDAVKLIYENKPAYIYAFLIYYNQDKENKQLLENFILNADKIESLGHYGKRLTTFGYGIDEIFINDILLPIIKNYTVVIEYQISYFLYHSKQYLLEKKNMIITSKILNMILGKYANKDFNVNRKLNYIDQHTYQIRSLNDINDHLSKRFTYVIEYLISNNIKWFEYPVLNFINKYLKNIVSSVLLINCNINTGVRSVDLIDTIYTS